MIASITDRILGLHGWGAVAAVFLLPALESSAFVGFIFPGEIAVLLGGVLAYQHKVSLPAVLVAAVAGAIVGDSVGYEIGKRWGRCMLHGTIGRIVKHEHLDRAEAYLAERGGKAVFFGRFTAALRVLIPGLAGMSGLRYRTFLAYNAAGGALWATGFVLAGYAAGSSWRRVEHVAGRASLVLLLLLVVGGAVVIAARAIVRHQQGISAFGARQLERPPLARIRARYRRQVDFVARRLQPAEARGLSLTLSLAVLVAAGWVFGAIAQDVIACDDAALLDRPVLDWFIAHREPWLTTTMNLLTALGSSGVLIPLVALAGGWWWRRRRTVRPLITLGVAYIGAELLFRIVKVLTDRQRPSAAVAFRHYSGLAFPSGHATLAAAVFGALAALTAAASSSWPAKVASWAAAVFITIVVGVSRLYLGAHWLTDVLGGWALGAMWLTAVLVIVRPATPTDADADEAASDTPRRHPRPVRSGP